MSHGERQLEKQENKEMVRDFINYLPSEIVFVIFSKLPVRILAICRCVCKSWRNLVGSHEFVKFHHSQSAPFIAIRKNNKSYKIFESNDDLDLEQHQLHYMLFTEFSFPHAAALQGSTNGLLFFERCYSDDRRLYICNPITRDYIELPKVFGNGTFATYGFGASKTSGQHKVVGIFHGYNRDKSGCKRATKSECHVYTLGTRSWRSIAASSGDSLNYAYHMNAGAFVNENLHWLVRDDDHDVFRKPLISCFDLETEVFSTFPPPPHDEYRGRLCVVGHWLCFCERRDDVMTIWLAKEEKCWTKEFVITTTSIYTSYGHNQFSSMYPIKVFGDGSVLIAPSMLYYSKTTKTSHESSGIFHPFMGEAIVYTPSFLSLKGFGMETATSF